MQIMRIEVGEPVQFKVQILLAFNIPLARELLPLRDL
jgi:hypothetical protein